MVKKKFVTAPKPKTLLSTADIEEFELGGVGQDEKPQNHKTTKPLTKKTKRLSVDLPEDTHTRFKVACAKSGLKMANEIESFIERRCDELENQ